MPAEIEKRPKSLNKRANDRLDSRHKGQPGAERRVADHGKEAAQGPKGLRPDTGKKVLARGRLFDVKGVLIVQSVDAYFFDLLFQLHLRRC